MALKILYVVGEGSTRDDIELRWSLRSLQKHCTCPVEPVIVGNVPEWFVGNGIWCEDIGNRKEKNILHKIRKAIEERLVQGVFQISADDHIWNRDIDLSELPVYYRNETLPAEVGRGNNYVKSLVGTRRVMEKMHLTVYDTTVHCNQWAKADQWREIDMAVGLAEQDSLAGEYGVAAWALLPNLYIDHGRWRKVERKKDIKFGETKYGDFLNGIDGEIVYSINDAFFGNAECVLHVASEYGQKSRWEK